MDRERTKRRLLAMWRIAHSLGMAGFKAESQSLDLTACKESVEAGLTFEEVVGDGSDQDTPTLDDWRAL